MNHLIILFTFFLSCNSFAQPNSKLALINEAELAIVDGNLEKAAGIYEQLFLQKDEIWAQDLYNAAVVEMKLGSFDNAKKYLNELAKRGIPLDEIEEKGAFKEAYEWDNYKITYSQYSEFSNAETKYDHLINQSNVIIDSLNSLSSNYRNMLPKLSIMDDKYTIKILDEPEIVLDSTIGGKHFFDLYNKVCDSVSVLPKWTNEIKRMNLLKDNLVDEFIVFLTVNEFPQESQINKVSISSDKYPFYNILQDVLEVTEFEYNKSGGTSVYMRDNPLILYPEKANQKQKVIIDYIANAVKTGKLKSEIAFYILFPNNYYKMVPFRTAFVHIENPTDCEITNNQMYFLDVLGIDATIHKLWEEKLALHDVDNLKKKLVYHMTNNSPYIFNIYTKVEQAQFPSCESAMMFLKSSKENN